MKNYDNKKEIKVLEGNIHSMLERYDLEFKVHYTVLDRTQKDLYLYKRALNWLFDLLLKGKEEKKYTHVSRLEYITNITFLKLLEKGVIVKEEGNFFFTSTYIRRNESDKRL